MSGRARRKAVKRYIKYLRKGSRFRFARQMGRFVSRYKRLAEGLYTQENFLLTHLKKKYPDGIPSYSCPIIDKPLVSGETPEE